MPRHLLFASYSKNQTSIVVLHVWLLTAQLGCIVFVSTIIYFNTKLMSHLGLCFKCHRSVTNTVGVQKKTTTQKVCYMHVTKMQQLLLCYTLFFCKESTGASCKIANPYIVPYSFVCTQRQILLHGKGRLYIRISVVEYWWFYNTLEKKGWVKRAHSL